MAVFKTGIDPLCNRGHVHDVLEEAVAICQLSVVWPELREGDYALITDCLWVDVATEGKDEFPDALAIAHLLSVDLAVVAGWVVVAVLVDLLQRAVVHAQVDPLNKLYAVAADPVLDVAVQALAYEAVVLTARRRLPSEDCAAKVG